MFSNENWKNPLYWLVILVGTATVAVGSKYLSELAEKKIKEEGLWPTTEDSDEADKTEKAAW
jgi:hypothetical protein